MYMLVSEGVHYKFIPGPESNVQWFAEILLEKYRDTVVAFSDINIDGKTGQLDFRLKVMGKDRSLESEDEFQLICSSILQDILNNSIVDKSARFVDKESGEMIGY